MRLVMKRAWPLAAVFLALSGSPARASDLKVHVPFPFVVHGRTLPAGQYLVRDDESDPAVVWIRGEKDTRGNMFVLTMSASGHDPAGDKPALTFTRHENQYRLSDIWESRIEGREIAGS